jgi:hypothetical protein
MDAVKSALFAASAMFVMTGTAAAQAKTTSELLTTCGAANEEWCDLLLSLQAGVTNLLTGGCMPNNISPIELRKIIPRVRSVIDRNPSAANEPPSKIFPPMFVSAYCPDKTLRTVEEVVQERQQRSR